MDKDGIEDGDQGKKRKPHDHNRDYAGASIYPSVRAIRQLVPKWSRGRLKVACDFHCPWIRGPHNEAIYMVGSPHPAMWKQQAEFGKVLEAVQTGPLVYSSKDNLPFGTAWNTGKNYGSGGARYADAVDDLVLSPLGVLHEEIDRLLRQEMPSAICLRPILDAIGLGAHRSCEIAARLQVSATSITRNFQQLQDLGYIRREVPYGISEKRSKKAVYKLADPFLRLWFRTVAPHRGSLQSSSKPVRRKLLNSAWPWLRSEAWETLCREAVPYLRLANLVPQAVIDLSLRT